MSWEELLASRLRARICGRQGKVAMDQVVFNSIYKDVLRTVHYSSIPHFMEYLEGRRVDQRFGTSCGFQALEVGRRLAEVGAYDARYFMDGRHAAAIASASDGSPYLFDPYLLHTDVISLRECTGPTGCAFPAFPLKRTEDGTLHTSSLKVRYLPEKQTISLEYSRLNAKTLQVSLNRYFRLRLDRPMSGPPSAAEIAAMLYHPEQNNLSVRVIDVDEGDILDLIYPICYYHGGPEPRVEHLIIRSSAAECIVVHSEGARFRQLLARVAKLVGVSIAELIDFVLDGARTYERYAPRQIEYAPFTAYAPSVA